MSIPAKQSNFVKDTVRRETLAVGKFGEFTTKTHLAKENLANFPSFEDRVKNINFINGRLRCQMCEDSEDGDIHVFI